jgi:hypothetical protein
MFDSETIKDLKQVNISTDAPKTRARVAALWKKAPKPQRQEIFELTGLSAATIQRSYKTGNISAKLVVPLAQVLNVNPFFLTGESDDASACTDELLNGLVETHGCKKPAKHRGAAKRGRRKKQHAAEKQAAAGKQARAPEIQPGEAESAASPVPQPSLPESAAAPVSQPDSPKSAAGPEPQPNLPKSVATGASPDSAALGIAASLTDEDTAVLLKALLLRAKAGGKYAETADKVKLLLLS